MTVDLVNAVVNTVIVGVVAIVAVQGLTTYALARLFITRRGMFERREDVEPESEPGAITQFPTPRRKRGETHG